MSERSMLLIPIGSVAFNDVFSCLAVNAASITVSDSSVDTVEANVSLVEDQVNFPAFVELDRNVNRGHGLVSWLLPSSAFSASVNYRLYEIESGFVESSCP